MDRRRAVFRAAALLAALTLPMVASYALVRPWRETMTRQSQSPQISGPASQRGQIPSGRHLVAFVFVSSRCGATRLPETERAIRQLRTELQRLQTKAFANVSVVGVAIDELRDGSKYLQSLNRTGEVFDEVSVGRTWLNQVVSERVWRDGTAQPLVPQVLVIERKVDAREFPRIIHFQRDSVLLTVAGAPNIVAWVARGAPVPLVSGALRATPDDVRSTRIGGLSRLLSDDAFTVRGTH